MHPAPHALPYAFYYMLAGPAKWPESGGLLAPFGVHVLSQLLLKNAPRLSARSCVPVLMSSHNEAQFPRS